MSTTFTKIEGSYIRRRLRELGLPGGGERVCCGGRLQYSKDYKTQLRSLQMHGNFKIMEKGVVMDTVSI